MYFPFPYSVFLLLRVSLLTDLIFAVTLCPTTSTVILGESLKFKHTSLGPHRLSFQANATHMHKDR